MKCMKIITQNENRGTRSYLSIARDEKIHQTQWVHKQLNWIVNVNYSLEKGNNQSKNLQPLKN